MIIWVVEQRDQEYASFNFLLWSLDILWSYHRLNLVELALCMYSVVNNFHSIRLALWTTEFQYLLDLVIDIFNSINAQSIASSCLLVSTRRRRQQEDDINKKATSTRRRRDEHRKRRRELHLQALITSNMPFVWDLSV